MLQEDHKTHWLATCVTILLSGNNIERQTVYDTSFITTVTSHNSAHRHSSSSSSSS